MATRSLPTLNGIRPGKWAPPFRLCDFCRRPVDDPSRQAMSAHLAGCAERTAYGLDPKGWFREYWLVRGTAGLRVLRVAGRPDPADPPRILSTPRPGTVTTSESLPSWGRLGASVFNHPALAREYGAWRLERLAAEYERLAESFRRDDKVVDQVGYLDHRVLTLPR